MRILKRDPLLKMVNSYVIDSPQPSNLSYLWNFGSLLAFCLIIQIVTGVTLGMHYTPNILEAFDSVEHIMRDVNNGWLVRYLHSNTASAFFFLVYLHIGRGLYYGSYKAPRTLVWVIGTVILILMIATAFLGYIHSPKWFKLNLVLDFFSFLNEIHIYNIINSLLLFIFSISFILFYLDNFKLSDSCPIKCFQLFSFIGLLFIIILTIWNITNFADILCYAKDRDNIDLHGHVSLNEKAAAEVGRGLSILGSNLGLGASIVGIGTAVGKTIAKSSMPPLQKAGVIIGSGLITGIGHSIITNVNVYRNSNVKFTSKSHSNDSYEISKFIDDGSSSPLQNLLFDIEALNYICLSLMFILVIQISFKFYLKDSIKWNLSSIIGTKSNDKLEFYINKIILLNKKMSHVYIWFAIALIIIGLSFSAYASGELYNNIDGYIALHNSIKSK